MQSLYLLLNLGSLFIPLIFSFHPRLKFYNYWKPLSVGLFISFLIFIPWDIIFTANGIWGFNADYFFNIRLFYLPLEEWLFFICIPYACVFTHYALLEYFPEKKLSIKATRTISYFLVPFFLFIAFNNLDKWYTLINFLLASIISGIALLKTPELLRSYYLTFLVMLIPFFVVNGILTGSFITHEVVWYNNLENLNIRLFTIPIEDVAYAFSLILVNLFVIELLRKHSVK
ncbi:lycopene cyclase domain-containing protein [Snuella sedimenti]|uniref:Lycopene cyclase domain-containing protein n=1 Tax=Snuella sedimenti TaxID=2798802 RepID=A0A8J7IIE4_9FLAO|nr:lycopene cyclase domain-containing protein [Snuella sedimenti]MBJ6368896.1 lycopene cyclase domain-containing protein [Snuella sedimenti]